MSCNLFIHSFCSVQSGGKDYGFVSIYNPSNTPSIGTAFMRVNNSIGFLPDLNEFSIPIIQPKKYHFLFFGTNNIYTDLKSNNFVSSSKEMEQTIVLPGRDNLKISLMYTDVDNNETELDYIGDANSNEFSITGPKFNFHGYNPITVISSSSNILFVRISEYISDGTIPYDNSFLVDDSVITYNNMQTGFDTNYLLRDDYLTRNGVCPLVANISSSSVNNGETTSLTSITFDIELITNSQNNFTIDDIVVTNGNKTNFNGIDINNFVVDISPISNGEVTITIPANSFSNFVETGNEETSFLFTYQNDSETTQPEIDYNNVESVTILLNFTPLEI